MVRGRVSPRLAHSIGAAMFLSSLVSGSIITTTNTCNLNSTVVWQSDCSAFGYPSINSSVADCGTIRLPADYTNCSAGVIDFAVARKKATLTPKLGTIFTNPGGPGLAGVQFLLENVPDMVNKTGGHYDVVSWDPRGVGYTSLLIDCYADAAEQAEYIGNGTIMANAGPEAFNNFTNPVTHQDPDEIRFWSQLNVTDTSITRIGQLCLSKNGDNLKYVGTVATVKDILAMADALVGVGSKVDYYGISYGTIVGSYLLNIFPERAGKVILDGVVNPVLWAAEQQYKLWGYQIADTPSVLAKFAQSCAEVGPTYCAIAQANSTQESILTWIQQELMNRAFQLYDPVNFPDSLPSSLVRAHIFGGLYSSEDFASFGQELALLKTQIDGEVAQETNGTSTNTTSLQARRPSRMSVGSRLRKRTDDSSTFDSVQQAVACADAVDPGNTTTVDVFNSIIATASNVSQLLGPVWDFSYYCHKWPARAVERYTGPWNATLTQPALLISNTFDNISPLKGAELVAEMLGSSAVLLKRDGYGHSSLADGSPCTDAAIAAFYTNGSYPAAGTVCPTDTNYFNITTTASR
ncbi:hypothetical protein DL93DRAFT_2171613 [Clavulina sp. PMI_390]|nr:hypothetical protein DL93DRAFT_2171613 [Clavulina sp. PMI_390]